MMTERSSNLRLAGRIAPPLMGAVAVIAGAMVLLGWSLDITVLKSIRPDWVFMKPNTALCFILIGLAMLFNPRKHSAFVARLAQLCALLAGLIGLLALIEYVTNSNFGIDQLLFHEPTGTVGTSHAGRMAPDTAIGFVLLAVGLEIARRTRPKTWMVIAMAVFGALVTTLSLVEIMSYLTPSLRTTGWGGLTMMALPTAILFAILAIALLLMAGRSRNINSASDITISKGFELRSGLGLLLVFLLLASGITAAGIFSFRSYRSHYRASAEAQLASVADLKVGELIQWRKERIGDANILYNNPTFSALVQRFFANPDDDNAKQQVRNWISRVQKHLYYAQIILTDKSGTTRLSVPANTLPITHLIQDITACLALNQVSFLDLHRHVSDGLIHMGLLIPLFDNQDGGRSLGLLAMGIDPEVYLYPFIKRWPVPSASAETLLVRREGHEVVFLNELRFQTNSALKLRVPLEQTALPAVQAVLGHEGIIEGIDYRGVAVMAALRSIPDSPWFLVARQDTKEVFAPLHERLWLTVLVMAALLIGMATGIGLIWRQQRLQFYRERVATVEALHESDRKFRKLYELSPFGIMVCQLITDNNGTPIDFMPLQVNPATEVLTGFGCDVLEGKKASELLSGEILTHLVNLYGEVLSTKQSTHHEEHFDLFDRTLDVTVFHFSHDLFIISFVDISDRKLAENALRQSEATIRNKLKAIVDPAGDLNTLELSDIIDTEIFKPIMENFYQITGMLGAILDISGKVLVAVGWQDICTKFHRCHPDTLKNCLESDTVLTKDVAEGNFKAYRCKNNMWDMVTPLMVGGRHVGNVFIGQFFYDDEQPDVELFRQQARRYGFDENEYLAAFERVPHFSHEKVNACMQFYSKLAALFSTLSFSTIKQSRLLAEQKQAEESLHISEEKFSKSFNLSPNMLCITRLLDGRFVNYNHAFLSSFEYPKEMLDKKTTVELGIWVKTEDQISLISDLSKGQPIVNREYLFKNKSGKIIPCLLSAQKFQINNVAYIITSLNDISQRKQAEKALAESEYRLNKAQQLASIGSWMQDVQTNKLMWSDETFRIFEIDKEFSGDLLDAFQSAIHPDDRELVDKSYKNSLITKKPYELVHKLLMSDGRVKYVHEYCETEYDASGNPVKSIGTVQDITEQKLAEDKVLQLLAEATNSRRTLLSVVEDQKRSEKKIHKLNAELEQRVIARTAQLEAANKELEAFSYSVSHDLRAPLRAVDGYTRMLTEDYGSVLDNEGLRICSVISEGARNMGQLIDDLLAFSRFGRAAIKLSVIDMKNLANAIFFELTTPEKRKRVDFILADLPESIGDPNLIRQVWMNLISNALKFSLNKEHALIEISALQQNNEVVYCVKDNGAGFDMRYVNKLFGVFQRLHSTKEFVGTGVGLAIVQRIVVRHGGRIWAEGQVDKGAKFYFTLKQGANHV